VLPGDVAPAHRHTQNALRFIVEGSKAYTAVNGERTLMHPGDLVLTPAWHWHDHGNDSELPMVWLDALDIPMVAFFDTSFSEMGNAESQTVVRPMGDSDRRFGNNLAPVDWQPATQSSPIFNYPYARTLETLQPAFQVTPTGQPMERYFQWSRVKAKALLAGGNSDGRPAMFSSYPVGWKSHTAQARMLCCSAFLIARHRKNSASGENNATELEIERLRLRNAICRLRA